MKNLQWREQDIYREKRWVASNDMVPGWLNNYEICIMENGQFRVSGMMKSLRWPNGEVFTDHLTAAKAFAEDDYRRRQRAEAWREYIETHDPPKDAS